MAVSYDAEPRKTLVVVTGATASGKTSLAIDLARMLDTEIVSADSRQMYRGMPIGTAAPTAQELAAVPHHFIGNLEVTDYYSAALFEEQALEVIARLHSRGNYAVMCGGSMMYVDAVVNGIDNIPTISDHVRSYCAQVLEQQGIEGVRAMLRRLDPDYLARADAANHRRLVHALEICMESGTTYSSLRRNEKQTRPFRTVKLALDMPRDMLFARINARVEAMLRDGLLHEVASMLPYRHLNALNTVGYKEMFRHLDGEWDLATAAARMAKNTRVYAKKQLTWLRRDPSVIWLDATLPAAQLRDAALEAVATAEH